MATLAHVGNGDGVTKPSRTPGHAEHRTSPNETEAADLPSSARASARLRGPGSTTVQPSLSPTPAAMKSAVSSSIPCGRISPKNSAPRPAAIM